VDNMDTKEIIDEIDNGKIAVFEVPLKNYFGIDGKKILLGLYTQIAKRRLNLLW